MANQFQNNGDLIWVRDYGDKAGYTNYQYDGNSNKNSITANKNGVNYAFDTSGLTNIDGKLYGTQKQLDDIFSRPMSQVRNTATAQGVNVGYDQYGNPTLNGQAVSTKGMTYNNGNWYMEGNALGNLIEGVKPQQYTNPYADTIGTLLDDLLNYKEFSYDPSEDEALKKAQEDSMILARQQAYDMGRGNTSWMDYQTQKVADDLASAYEQKAYEKYIADKNYLMELLGQARGVSQDALNEYNINESLKEQRRATDLNTEYQNRMLANENKRLENEIYDTRADNARADRELNESINQFNKTMNWNKAQFDEEMLYNWARHELDGKKFVSDQEERKAQQVLNAFIATGIANEETELWFGIPAGTPTIDYLNYVLASGKFDYQKQKDVKKPKGVVSDDDDIDYGF